MTEITMLGAHDAMPSGPDRQVVVLRRFEEDSPGRGTVQIILTGSPEEVTHPRRPDGTPMHLDEAIQAATKVAASEGIGRVYVLDRLLGERERDIMQHDGDHSVHNAKLRDSDPEDGEAGADMRDIAHPAR